MKKKVYAALGHICIDKITPLDIQRFVSSLVANGLATSNVKRHVRLASVILSYAVKKRILTYNPCLTVDYPKAQEQKRDFYSVEEVKICWRYCVTRTKKINLLHYSSHLRHTQAVGAVN